MWVWWVVIVLVATGVLVIAGSALTAWRQVKQVKADAAAVLAEITAVQDQLRSLQGARSSPPHRPTS